MRYTFNNKKKIKKKTTCIGRNTKVYICDNIMSRYLYFVSSKGDIHIEREKNKMKSA